MHVCIMASWLHGLPCPTLGNTCKEPLCVLLVCCSALGADMYDSVYPTRTARFGVALVPEGVLKLKNSACAKDFR